MIKPKGCLSFAEAMKRLSVSRTTLWRIVRKERLLVVRRGKEGFLKLVDVERFQ
jgi:predicted DNA-binding protein (UPF0251 family)